jgi:NAD-reducing hydrogenase small subunit
MERLRLATLWLDGCSGCHMSFLDLDEFLIDLVGRFDVVYSPLVDVKEIPEGIDVALVEGAVGTDEDRHRLRQIRARSRVLIAFGDCAVTGNVTAMRNPLGGANVVLGRSYLENGHAEARIPSRPGILPVLLDKVVPIHALVPVDIFVPGCPPPAPRIREVLERLSAGEEVRLTGPAIRFG